MDYTTAKFWIDIAQFALTGGIAIWLYLERRNVRTHERIDMLETNYHKRNEEFGKALTELRGDINSKPDHDDLSDIHEKVNAATITIGKIEGELTVIRRLVEDINSYLRTSK